ncbi:hypothetical protein MCOR03_002827 [Pyricularia oryzae]|nr:hypothetical protein MCOR03_002827 [Pyricularia oryzae]
MLSPEVLYPYSIPVARETVVKSGSLTSLPVRIHRHDSLADVGAKCLTGDWGRIMGDGQEKKSNGSPSVAGNWGSFIWPECLPDRLDDAGPRRDKSIRDSEVALVPRTDTVRCIEARARSLQGWRDETWIERLRVQRYHVGGHYGHHFDWMEPRMGYARVSSIMAWVGDGDGSLVGGGTEFPLLQRPSSDDRWCKFVIGCGGSDDAEKDQRRQGGVVFKPIVGNAVFWENFNPQAGPGGVVRGYEESWHAGLPVERGVKVGLNVWSYGRVD